MNTLIDTPSPAAAAGGRIMIVDDDPVVAGMLGASLTAAGYEVVELYSGEEAVDLLFWSARGTNEPLPDIIFLDIEMGMGIDGYETCRRLRAVDALRNLPVLFLSAHDLPEDRLHAYDAGGNDFLAKPFVPEEVMRKAWLAIAHSRRQVAMDFAKCSAVAQATSALASLGDSGAALKFSRSALACRSLPAMASLIIESMGAFGIDCHVQLRTPDQILTMTPHGPASPLEESVFDISRSIDRVFSFMKRLIVNADNVSLLVTNMPVTDDDLCGRIRDQAAMITEAADLAVGNIQLRTDAVMRANELRKLAEASRQGVEELRANYRRLQLDVRLEFEKMTNTIEGMYVHLGLSNHQEFTISDTVRDAVDRVLTRFEGNDELDHNFASILDCLTQAGNYELAHEDEVAPDIELF